MPGPPHGPPHLGDVADGYLVDRARQGFLPAYEELVRRHQQRAYLLALRMTGDPHEAQDLTQEALVKAWQSLHHFDGRAAFTTWLHRITVNTCLDHLRRRRPEPAPPDPGAPAPGSVEATVEDGARAQALHQAIAGLPLDYRVALVLTTFLGYSYQGAGEVLGTSPDAVRGRAARARAALAQRMGGWR